MSVGCTQLLWCEVVSYCAPHVTPIRQPDTAYVSIPYGVSGLRFAEKLRDCLAGAIARVFGFVEHVNIVGHGAVGILHRAHAAPLAVHRAVLALRPAGARPVALAM